MSRKLSKVLRGKSASSLSGRSERKSPEEIKAAKAKRGRKRKARGRKAATELQKKGAKALGISLTEAKKKSDAELKAAIKEAAPQKPKAPKVKRTRAEQNELNRLIKSQERDAMVDELGSNVLAGRRKTGPKGQEVEQGPLLSKAKLPENVSPARRRSLVAQGKARVRPGKGGKSRLVETGEFAPARQDVADRMGLTSRGVPPSEKEIMDMGGFEIRKVGGKVKRNMGGKVRGVGQAVKGFGNATYSNKLI